MRTPLRRLLLGSAIAGGFTVLGIALSTASASAAEPGTTSGEDGIISGNQSGVTLTAPVDATGNQVTVIGDGNSVESSGSDSTGPGAGGGGTTSGDDGVVSGNQSEVTVTAPNDLSGNQVTVIGDDNDSSSGSDATAGSTSATVGTTSGDDGTGSGNQTGVDVTAPVDVSCNQLTVIGDDNTTGCSSDPATTGGGAGSGSTSGQDGTGSGNQTVLDVTAPVDAGGNQVTVIGDGNTNRTADDDSTSGGSGGSGSTSGQDGTGSGNQTVLDVTAPVDAGGNQVTVIGDGNTNRSPADSTGDSSEEPAGPAAPVGGSDEGSGPGGTTTSGGAQVPQGGTVITTAQGALPIASESVAGTTSLPRTGLTDSLQLLGLLGSLLLLAGAGLLLRERRIRTT